MADVCQLWLTPADGVGRWHHPDKISPDSWRNFEFASEFGDIMEA